MPTSDDDHPEEWHRRPCAGTTERVTRYARPAEVPLTGTPPGAVTEPGGAVSPRAGNYRPAGYTLTTAQPTRPCEGVSFSPDQAFGWPHLENSFPRLKDPYRHLITIGHHDLGDGYLHFVLPPRAFRDGDYEQAVALFEGF